MLLKGGAMTMTTSRFDLPAAARTAAKVAVPARIGLGLAGVVQLVFAFLAFWDLTLRDEKEVRGPKPAWIPVILVNWIGPAGYFLFGIKR